MVGRKGSYFRSAKTKLRLRPDFWSARPDFSFRRNKTWKLDVSLILEKTVVTAFEIEPKVIQSEKYCRDVELIFILILAIVELSLIWVIKASIELL